MGLARPTHERERQVHWFSFLGNGRSFVSLGLLVTSACRWDEGEKAWPSRSFVMKAYAGAIYQVLSTDMTNAESSTDVLSSEAMTGQR